jgi:hypothetical protein
MGHEPSGVTPETVPIKRQSVGHPTDNPRAVQNALYHTERWQIFERALYPEFLSNYILNVQHNIPTEYRNNNIMT